MLDAGVRTLTRLGAEAEHAQSCLRDLLGELVDGHVRWRADQGLEKKGCVEQGVGRWWGEQVCGRLRELMGGCGWGELDGAQTRV